MHDDGKSSAGSDRENESVSEEISVNNGQHVERNHYSCNGDIVNGSEDDDSISCKTFNAYNVKESIKSEHKDLNGRCNEEGPNSPSPSSLSSNLSQQSQSSILTLINNHEAKRKAASNTGNFENKLNCILGLLV